MFWHAYEMKGHHCRDSQPADLTAFADHLAGNYVPNSVIVDATASEAPAQRYLEWMQKGIHIITPNKKLNSGPLDQYQALKQFQRDSYIHYLYEVQLLGAPLPYTSKRLMWPMMLVYFTVYLSMLP